MILTLIEIAKNTFIITGIIMVMMMLIEYINTRTNGRPFRQLRQSSGKQVAVGALLGLIPGCMGGFVVVSLFTHNMMNFSALMAMTIAITGDEAFFLLALTPKTALLINILLLMMAVLTGLIINKFIKKFPAPFTPEHFKLHENKYTPLHEHSWKNIANNFLPISFQRAVLAGGLLVIIITTFFGIFEHDHTMATDVHGCALLYEADNVLFRERWFNLLFAVICTVTLILVAMVDDHFLKEHLWQHVIKKHFIQIFLWTMGALLVIYILLQHTDVHKWVNNNHVLVLFAAILIGLIPESGPHLIFITLFVQGIIPFSILLTNCIVQEGHAALPLLAESPRAFIGIKILKIVLGFTVGLCGYLVGF